jgi:hypothetical protein
MGRRGRGQEGYGERGWGKGREMTQTLYAHMNKKCYKNDHIDYFR